MSSLQRNVITCFKCLSLFTYLSFGCFSFSSQSLLKNHLVLHLRKVRPATVRPTISTPVARSSVSNQTLEVNSSTSRTYPSSQRGRTGESTTLSTSGCVSAANSSATSKQGPHPPVATRSNIGNIYVLALYIKLINIPMGFRW